MPIDSPEFKALLNHYSEILDAMPAKFTSHQFILALAQRYQHQYINYLYTYLYSPNPFQEAHLKLAKGLNRFSDRVSKGERVHSTDIFDHSSEVREWQKVDV